MYFLWYILHILYIINVIIYPCSILNNLVSPDSLLNCCFLGIVQFFQKANEVAHPFFLKNYSQFVLVYIVKSLSKINKAKSDIFLDLPCVSHYPWILAMGSRVSLALQNPAYTVYLVILIPWTVEDCKILSTILLACEITLVFPQSEHL